MLLRRSFRQASPRPFALLSGGSAGSQGLALASTASQQLLWSRTRGLATMPVSPTLRSARKKLGERSLTGIEQLTAEETYEVLQSRFAEYETIRTGFVANLFHKAQTPAHLEYAMQAFHYSQAKLVEPDQHMIWEIIHGCTRAGEPRRALELFASNKIRVWPLARQFNRLMANFIDAGDHDGAVQTYAALRKRQVDPNVYTYALLVRAHAAKGDTDKALAAAEEAKSALKSDTMPAPVADALMGAHWKSQNFDALRALVEEQAASNTTRSLDGALYASLAHLKGNNVSAAADLVRHATLAKPATPEQFEKWANTLAEEATAASLAQPAAGLLRALTDVAPDARATLEDLAAQLDAEASAASEQAAESEAPTEQEEQTEAASAEKKEEAQA